jgi:hypothetical protein
MLNRTSFLAGAVIITLGLTAAGTSNAAPGSGVDILQRPKNGQIFTKPGGVTSNTTPSGVIANSGGIVSKPSGFDPSKIVTKPSGNSGGIVTKPPGFDPGKILTPNPSGPAQGQGGGCGGPGEPACKQGGGGIGNGNCGHPGQPACNGPVMCTNGAPGPGGICKSNGGGSGNGNAGSPFPKDPGKLIVINRYPYPSGPYRYGSGGAPVFTPEVVSPVIRVAPTVVRPAAASVAPLAAPSCLTKEYLQAGVVLFKDVCTKEWAMNSTSVNSQVVSVASRTCLTKEYPQSEVVLFRDTCTDEWATNPPEQQAQAPQSPQVPAQ